MRFSKSTSVVTCIVPFMVILISALSAGGSAHAATNEASVAVILKVKFVSPPCNVTAPAVVDLGNLVPGNNTHTPFDVTITCPYAVKSDLYAGAPGHRMYSPWKVEMINTGGARGNPVLLSLTEEGSNSEVYLDGSGHSYKRFCQGTTTDSVSSRICSLIPGTFVSTFVSGGEKTATIKFTVITY